METPKNCGNAPIAVDLEEGKRYSWCSCGLALSETQPFCDGAHKGSGMRPLRFKTEKTDTFYLCMCKQTKTPPYCDGSHNN